MSELSDLPTSYLPPYLPRLLSRSEYFPIRGLNYHVRQWGSVGAPKIVMLHGWMDVSASFQFLVDFLAKDWHVFAPDWRGYGPSLADDSQLWPDTYWFPDYMADLDALLAVISPDQAVNLVAHSLGGNVAMLYAGVRPARVKALVNLEGYGMRDQAPNLAPARYAQWLDELRTPSQLRDYANLDEVARRLQKNNSRLPLDKALYLAQFWSRKASNGRFALAADPAHKLINPVLYRAQEVQECWKQITAPVMLVDSDTPDRWADFIKEPEFVERLKSIAQLTRHCVADAGHMLHHDQPQLLAELIESFLPRQG